MLCCGNYNNIHLGVLIDAFWRTCSSFWSLLYLGREGRYIKKLWSRDPGNLKIGERIKIQGTHIKTLAIPAGVRTAGEVYEKTLRSPAAWKLLPQSCEPGMFQLCPCPSQGTYIKETLGPGAGGKQGTYNKNPRNVYKKTLGPKSVNLSFLVIPCCCSL